jgi:hypothetical protein
MRRLPWGTFCLLALLGALILLCVGYRVAQQRGDTGRTIVHEIRQMIATLQTPLEVQPTPAGAPAHGLRAAPPAGVAVLAGLLLLLLGVRVAAQQRSRNRRS